MEQEIREYLRQRAETEQALAQAATHPNAAYAHRQLSSLYLCRLDEMDRREALLRAVAMAH
jgi:hypothetical protein